MSSSNLRGSVSSQVPWFSVLHSLFCATIDDVNSTIHARLDSDSRKALDQLISRKGWSSSRAVREGLRLLAACHTGKAGRTVLGLGKFSSGKSDLGSNKMHLRGFGR